ncbi:MAG: tetratricopeptide repeat protein, partial [Pseudomonadota bacterium]
MFASLFRRRVPQILGLYLGGGWVAVEFVSFLTERYLLSDALTDLTLVALFAMTPAVLMMAWFHGTPGRDVAPTVEKILVPINVIATLALVGVMFHGEELGATATEVTAVDETGQTVTRMAPKESFRRRAALFFFESEDEDESLDWLRYGLPVMLQRDLEQDAFLSIWSPLEGWEQSGMLGLQRAGFSDGLNVPLPLMRQIAQNRGYPGLLTGTFRSSDGGIRVEVTVHWTNNENEPQVVSAHGSDPMEAVDALTLEIKRVFDIPSASASMVPDLPVAEHFSSSVEAIRLFTEATVAARILNDRDTAVARYRQAVDEDPAFSAAHLQSAMDAFNAGQGQQAIPAVSAARRHDYKLLYNEKFWLKSLEYSLEDQMDKVTSVYETWAELYPDDFDALTNLAFSYLFRENDTDKAIDTFEQMREVDPAEYWVLTQLAELRSMRGETEQGLALMEEYAAARPQDFRPWFHSGRLRLGAGDLPGARSDLERAVLMSSGRVDPVLELARLDLREGEYDEAQAHINEASRIASAPRQDAAVLAAQIDYFRSRGMLDEMVSAIGELYTIDAAYRNPINLMMTSFMDYVEDYAKAGMGDFVLQRLAEYETQFQPPLSELVQIGYLRYFLETGDIEKSQPTLERVTAMVKA